MALGVEDEVAISDMERALVLQDRFSLIVKAQYVPASSVVVNQ